MKYTTAPHPHLSVPLKVQRYIVVNCRYIQSFKKDQNLRQCTPFHTHTSTNPLTHNRRDYPAQIEVSRQRGSEWLNRLLLDALGEDIPEGGSNILEGSLAVCWSAKARRDVSTKKVRDRGEYFSKQTSMWRKQFCCGYVSKREASEAV